MKSGRVQIGQTVDTATAQAYNIKVTDASGNALPKDQIIIEAGDKSGKQVQMSVEEFLQLDRREILQRLG